MNGEKEFQLAIQLNPRDPITYLWYANVLAALGDYREGLIEINTAQELNPSSHAILADKYIMLFKSGKPTEGIELLKEVERDDPKFRSPHQYLMSISFTLGDYPTYLDEGEKEADSTHDSVIKETLAAARTGYANGGERGLLDNLYAKQKTLYTSGRLWGTILAKTCVKMGKRQEALQLLERDFARHSPVFLWCLTEPDLLTLKEDARYKALLQKITFPH